MNKKITPELPIFRASLLLILLLLLTTCGGYDPDSTGGTGDIAFKIDWQGTPTSSKSKIRNPQSEILSYAPIDCTAIGVSIVSATVYSSTGSSLTTGGPWSCSDHSGNITSVPAGSDRKLAIFGKDSSGNILYYGEQTGITVVDGQTSSTVTVTVTPTGSAPSAPTGVTATAGNGQVSISWSPVSGATSYNIYWSTATGVTKTTGTKITGATSSYTHTGLTNGTTYYHVVTAVNSYGESSESSQVSETPLTVGDVDNNVYNTVTIGTQIWFKENLKVTRYRNGDTIGTTAATKDISGETSPKYQWAYNGDEGNVATYGRLYTWYAATDSRAVCPTGWHVPTNAEWTTLEDYLGGSSVAGGKMKEAGTTHWDSPNTSADNSSGFTALPGGSRFSDGSFSYMGYYGYWWSATEGSASGAWTYGLYYSIGYVNHDSIDKYRGFSIRCVRD